MSTNLFANNSLPLKFRQTLAKLQAIGSERLDDMIYAYVGDPITGLLPDGVSLQDVYEAISLHAAGSKAKLLAEQNATKVESTSDQIKTAMAGFERIAVSILTADTEERIEGIRVLINTDGTVKLAIEGKTDPDNKIPAKIIDAELTDDVRRAIDTLDMWIEEQNCRLTPETWDKIVEKLTTVKESSRSEAGERARLKIALSTCVIPLVTVDTTYSISRTFELKPQVFGTRVRGQGKPRTTTPHTTTSHTVRTNGMFYTVEGDDGKYRSLKAIAETYLSAKVAKCTTNHNWRLDLDASKILYVEHKA